tara:strand:+ start:492 stop:668 length:177 start_codon:yes stop_codon:yes gene_type:complete
MAGLVLARKERKEILREEARERQVYYNNLLSTEAGIRSIMASCGKKQHAKLTRLLNKK